MRKAMIRVLALMALLTLLEPVAMAPTTAAPAVPQKEGVYEEDFTAHSYKDYVENTEWNIWAGTLRLGLVNGSPQTEPAIARDSRGDILVVWEDYRNGNADIYAQKLDGSGNQLWAADVRVNSDSDVQYQGDPAVMTDKDGDIIVVWQDTRDDCSDIYAQKLDTNGNQLWTADIRTNSDGGILCQYDPVVAVDGSGNAVVVWWDFRDGDSNVYAQKLGRDGNKFWASDVRINSDGGKASQIGCAIAMDGNGHPVIVWGDERNTSGEDYYDIYAQKLDEGGSKLWAGDVRVNSEIGTAQWHEHPAVAVDGHGSAAVVWRDARNNDDSIYAQKLDRNGNKLWGTDVRVNSESGTVYVHSAYARTVVTVDGSGNAVVVWKSEHNGDIYAQKLDTGGNRLWATDVRVNSDSGQVSAYSRTAVAVDGSGNTTIVWEGVGIYAQKLDGSGNRLWGVDVRVNSDNGTTHQTSSDVAVDGDGNAIVVWQDHRNGIPNIYAQKLDGSGNRLWAADVRVNSESRTAYQWKPAVAVDGDGNPIIVWQDYYGNVYAQKLDESGNRLWAMDTRIKSGGGRASEPVVAIDRSGNAVVAWRDTRSDDGDIYTQKLDKNGNKLWAADVRVNSDSGTTRQWQPSMTVDGSGNATVVWEDKRSGNWDIYAQRLDSSGGKLWVADVRVNSNNATAQWVPTVAVDADGNAIVMWWDYRNDGGDIYAQRLDGGGVRVWPADVRVNSDSASICQKSPAVAAEGTNCIVVWHDDPDCSTDSNSDIYAQMLDVNGDNLWAADVRVNSDSGTTRQESPAVAVDGNGNIIVVWKDTRNGNWDVYAQRINTVGSKRWLADLQIVYPDKFYFDTGTGQSRTIDALAGNIRSATLTADYQANGGEVQFYLTNDGGVHWVPAIPGVIQVFTTTGSDLRWRAVLTADPVWLRTPIVNSLRIEYSNQNPYADDYEMDDTCTRAQPIQVNGASQAHTFHQYADADWAWFEALAGTTYVVQAAHTGPDADLELELYDACEDEPVPPDDIDTFGNDARLVFTAPTDDIYCVKALNHDPAVYGEHTGYLLSVRTRSLAPLVAIVAGRNEANELESNIIFMGDQAYRTFRRAGVPRENIRYLSVGPDRDADQDGLLDVNGVPSRENVRYAVQDWPRERGVWLGVPFYLYLVDHGGTDYFCAEGCEEEKWVSAADLNLWLSNLEATTGADQINVIIEACYSGSFIDVTEYGPATISSGRRVVIASTGSRARAFPSERGGYFSDAFFAALGDNADLCTAYEKGRTAAQAAWPEQTPWLDDNGDAVADGNDCQIARGGGLVSFGGGSIPVVDWLRVGEVNESGEATVTARIRDDVAVLTATVEIYSPGLTVPDTGEGETPVLPVAREALRDSDGDGVYEGVHGGFTEKGVYRLVAYAWDNDGNPSLPQQATVGERKVFLPLLLRR